ncbi:hypothetical protein HDU98_011149 [Podochytrium sp. JEL0797]|nr:hypothetical protein HDU98_011149 [Podochytrium sp. JEL0797]
MTSRTHRRGSLEEQPPPRRAAPRILSRNGDGFFEGGGAAGDTSSLPIPSPRSESPRNEMSASASGSVPRGGARLVRDANGFFVPMASKDASLPREASSREASSRDAREASSRDASSRDPRDARDASRDRSRPRDIAPSSSSKPPTNPPRGTSRRRPSIAAIDSPLPLDPDVPLPVRSKSTRRPPPPDTQSDAPPQPQRSKSASRKRPDERSERSERSDRSDKAERRPAKEDAAPPARTKRPLPQAATSPADKDAQFEPADENDEDVEAAIAKAKANRKRKSQFIKEKKKKDEDTIRREKEEKEAKELRRKERERKELEKKDTERRLIEIERIRVEGERIDVNESIIEPDYIEGIIRTLLNEATPAPTPADIQTHDGVDSLQTTNKTTLKQIKCDLLSERYIDGPARREALERREMEQSAEVVIFLKVMEASDVYIKGNGKGRECYCRIEFGERPDDGACGSRNTETFVTEVVAGMENPFMWNQHLNIDAKSVMDQIIVSVWDQRKDEFLGQVVLNVEDIVERNERDGYVSKWFALQPRLGRKGAKDKYVGGEILLEFNIDRNKTDAAKQQNNRDEYLTTELISFKINFIALYKLLLRACVTLDMLVIDITESTVDLLSNESKTLLRVYGKCWSVGESAQFISFVDLLFNKYKNYEIPVNALFVAYESIYNRIKSNPNWLTKYEKPALSDLSEQMHDYYRTQVIKYKEFFPKNRPNGALENTILMWRMVYKSEIYRENHPELPVSFKDHIKGIVTASFESRYEKLYELTSAIDEGDFEAVVEGLTKLTDMLTDEIEMDVKYYKSAFRKDIDIVKLSIECYTTAFLKTIEEQQEFFTSAEGVAAASGGIFELVKRVRRMDAKLNKIMPGKATIHAEKMFSPFILKWLDFIGTKTVEWVANAMRADTFEPIGDFDYSGGDPPHSSSVMDVFTAVNHELSFIIDLKWENRVQSAGFYQKFAKTIFTAIEQYCDVIGTGELKPVANGGKQWTDLLNQMRAQQKTGPTDIQSESCVKLCNIEFALSKLEELTKIMNVAALSQTTKDYRATIAPVLKQKADHSASSSTTASTTDGVAGSFKVQVMYAENIKPVTNTGLANSYVTIRVPEGTCVPPPDPMDVTGIHAGTPTENGIPTTPVATPQTLNPGAPVAHTLPAVLNGSNCEMARTRVIAESINPVWDEEFTILLPPVTRLDVNVFSKNLITNDPLCGQATLDLGDKSRLRRKLGDHHTHDVFLELEPQGRVLLRLTLDGELEDVEFWFRRAREKLGRTRNDFVRSLSSRISPYAREVLVKALKEQEAAPVKAQGYFAAAFQKTTYGNLTVAGVEIGKAVSSREADDILAPLTDYLNKNLDTLFSGLSSKMATEVIKKIWEDSLLLLEAGLIPQLYGPIEKDRKYLNKRQVSILNWTLDILKQFFHAGGADLGLPIKTLETRKYVHDAKLIDVYDRDLKKLKADYELSLIQGREKEYLLRLIRLRVERQDDLSSAEKEEGRKWVEVQLVNRKEKPK